MNRYTPSRSCRARWRITALAHNKRSDWSDRLSIKLFANSQSSRVFMTKHGLGTKSRRWVTELLSTHVVCNPWLRIIYIESRSVNTTKTKRQTIKSCSLNSTAICRRVKLSRVNLALVNTHLIQIISSLEESYVHELCSNWGAPYTVSIAPPANTRHNSYVTYW